MTWLRNNVLGGVVTTVVLIAISGAWAWPGRLSSVEQAAAANSERHASDMKAVSERRGVVLEELRLLRQANERTQAQAVSIMKLQELQIAQVDRALRERDREPRGGGENGQRTDERE